MKFFSFVATILSLASTIYAFETDVKHEQQHHRDLQAVYNLYKFACGKTLIVCGNKKVSPIQKEYACPNPASTTSEVKGTTTECAALIAEARKYKDSVLYTSSALCANGQTVTSHIKYTTDGEGKYCKKGQSCLCCRDGSSFGDPHFVTYDGTAYDYHGQCDLVMATSKLFGDGLGVHVHARTEIVTHWSLISNAAVQIGTDVLELTNKGVVFFNEVDVTASLLDEDNNKKQSPIAIAGLYNVTMYVKVINDIPRTTVMIALNEVRENIKLTLFKRLISVHVGVMEEDLSGMLGSRVTPGLVGRDSQVLASGNEMGTQWQVNANHEPMLFHETASPQYPAQCILPSSSVSSRRRLRATQSDQLQKQAVTRRAEELCAEITNIEMRKFCIEDVMLTGDNDVSLMYEGGVVR